MRKITRKTKWITLCVVTFVLVLLVSLNCYVVLSSRGLIFSNIDEVPSRRVGVVLGTSPLSKGRKSICYETRMDAAAALFHAKKVSKLLVTGDNGTVSYDETTAMRESLIERGVPVDAIACDYAGFRTLDSIIRAKKVFGLSDCIVVTNEFHEPRTVFIARSLGLDVVGFSAAHNLFDQHMPTSIREFTARIKMLLDLYVLKTRPKFLGPRITV